MGRFVLHEAQKKDSDLPVLPLRCCRAHRPGAPSKLSGISKADHTLLLMLHCIHSSARVKLLATRRTGSHRGRNDHVSDQIFVVIGRDRPRGSIEISGMQSLCIDEPAAGRSP